MTFSVLARCVLLLLPTLALADQITLKNGDRLTGSVVKLDGKNVIFKSEFAGAVTIPWEAVTSLVSSTEVFVGLANNQLLKGTLNLEDGRAQVATKETGSVSAERKDILSIRSKDEQTAYDTQMERLRNPRLLDLWTGSVDFGLALAQGNAQTSTVNTNAVANRATTRDNINVHFTSLYSSNEQTGKSVATANAIRGGIKYDLNITPRVFAFGLTDLEYDQFQNLDLRFSPAGGFGYKAWKKDKSYFSLQGGVAMNREFFSTGLNRTSAEGLFGEELLYKIGARTTLAEKLLFFANFSNAGNYRTNFDASVDTAVWRWISWQVSLSDRLLSNPNPGRKKNDVLFTTGVRLIFKR